MLFFIVHDVPGRVRLRARSGFSLRKAQVLADRLDAVDVYKRQGQKDQRGFGPETGRAALPPIRRVQETLMNLASIYASIGPSGVALVFVGCAGLYLALRNLSLIHISTAYLHVPASQVQAFAAAMSEANVIAYKEGHR